MVKRYTSVKPFLSMTVMVDGTLQTIRFHNGYFETGHEGIQKAIESNIHFGGEILALMVDVEKVKAKVKEVQEMMGKKPRSAKNPVADKAKDIGMEVFGEG